MEPEEGQEGEAEEIGWKSVDRRDAEQGLEGDEHAQETADLERREIRVGLGLVAGEVGDAGDIEAKDGRAEQRGGG